MPVALHVVPLIFISLLSCCFAEEIACPAGACACKYVDKDGIPQLLSNCSQASLQDVPQGLDSRTTALDVSDNNITRLQNDTFDRIGILHLDRVFLRRNYIVGLESGTFRKLSSLSELHLESNLITSILPGTFWGNPKLIMLNLRNNRLSSLPVDIATFKNHIQELDIGDNSIQKVDTYLVQRYYPELRRLDVSRNRISRFFSTSPLDNSSLEVVDASYNYITELDPSAFSSASNLKELNVSNNEISSLSEDVFARNPELVRVDVTNNHILIIHRDAFRKNPKIREIYAGSNSMTYLHPDTFSKNPQLTKVTVSWNKIEDIHPQTFYNNPDLEFIDFNNNNLKTLNPDVFQNNPILRSVDLSSNSLVRIHDTTFHKNPNLEYLRLSKNKHLRFHSGLLILASSLKVFHAQHCNLSHLSCDFFKNATNLRELLLDNNNFTSLDCVSNTDSDEYVDTLTELQVIDLSNNQLQTIDVEIFKNKMTQLKSLRIEGNPFLCDCKLRNAWLWSQEVGIIPPQPQITCTDMQQRPVPWDDVEHLDCNDESHTEVSESTETRTEESSSSVTKSHMEESTYAVTYMHSEESTSTGARTFTEEPTSTVGGTHTEESNSTIRGIPTEESTSTATSTQPQHADHPEGNRMPDRAVPQVEDINISTREGRRHNSMIVIAVLLFLLLTVALGVCLVMFYVRRKQGMYKVSSTNNKVQKNRTDVSAPAYVPPAL
jgi:Leucine-rich repeat (LRR) protein